MVQYYDWLYQLEGKDGVESIDGELALFRFSKVFDGIFQSPLYSDVARAPHKFDFFLICFQFAGSAKVKIDMVEYDIQRGQNTLIKIAPGQILLIDEVSEDFDADIILLSRHFVENLLVYIKGSIPLRFDAHMPNVTICEPNDNAINIFIKAVSYVLRDKTNPYRSQVAQHVIMALFYSSEQIREHGESEALRSSADVLTKRFLVLVKDNFRDERQLQFYSDKLCITPRYLSRVVKECTGSSAAEWIERYVILEAKALLKSTVMTIQQISDELSFPSQTFFGKYFKRRVGMSPKEYRLKG